MAFKNRIWWGWAHEVQPESYEFYQSTQAKNTIFVLALTSAFVLASSSFDPVLEAPPTAAAMALKIIMAVLANSMVSS